MKGVNGRVALVTGAGSADGIGFATAKLLREAGAKVAITSTTDRIYDRLKELGGEKNMSFAKPADLTHSDEV
jgi:3-oxoacyl-[acyl-carrier protein] reductase